MLTIPESVKALFEDDSTRKNFRVQFPNGELADITNENINKESVKFTESICSQNVFRFGLAEASVIEFETVGVGNMYGMTIACSYEIDTDSLSAAEISAIQSDPGDGELVLASASDIGYGFYRIPLGVFRVEKCPRNHGAMTHRQVTAYSSAAGQNILPTFEKMRATMGIHGPFRTSVKRLLYEYIGNADPPLLPASFTATKFEYSQLGTETDLGTVYLAWTVGEDRYTVALVAPWTYGIGIVNDNATQVFTSSPYMFSFDIGDIDLAGAWNFIKSAFVESGATISDITSPAGAPSLELASRLYFSGVRLTYAYPGQIKNYIPIFYPVPFAAVYSYYRPTIAVYRSIGLSLTKNGTQISQFRTQCNERLPSITVYTATGGYENDRGITLTPSRVVETSSGSWNMFDDIDQTALVSGALEVEGQFAKTNRTGGVEIVNLSPSSPHSISPGDYDEVWWDEYDVSPIGTVTVTYRNGEEGEATANVTLGAGASLYDMTDNEVLKNLSTADLDSITTLLSGDFATNAQNVGFTPIEMTMQGWPWLEAGDALQITAEDGTIVNTYALRVEMSGIQHLMSDITAEGGEIIGEV